MDIFHKGQREVLHTKICPLEAYSILTMKIHLSQNKTPGLGSLQRVPMHYFFITQTYWSHVVWSSNCFCISQCSHYFS